MTFIDGEENQEINSIPVIEEGIRNENGLMEPNEVEISVRAETEITYEEHLIIDDLKTLISNETDESLLFKKIDQRKFRDVTKKVNAVMKHIETDVTETDKLAMAPALWVAKTWK